MQNGVRLSREDVPENGPVVTAYPPSGTLGSWLRKANQRQQQQQQQQRDAHGTQTAIGAGQRHGHVRRRRHVPDWGSAQSTAQDIVAAATTACGAESGELHSLRLSEAVCKKAPWTSVVLLVLDAECHVTLCPALFPHHHFAEVASLRHLHGSGFAGPRDMVDAVEGSGASSMRDGESGGDGASSLAGVGGGVHPSHVLDLLVGVPTVPSSAVRGEGQSVSGERIAYPEPLVLVAVRRRFCTSSVIRDCALVLAQQLAPLRSCVSIFGVHHGPSSAADKQFASDEDPTAPSVTVAVCLGGGGASTTLRRLSGLELETAAVRSLPSGFSLGATSLVSALVPHFPMKNLLLAFVPALSGDMALDPLHVALLECVTAVFVAPCDRGSSEHAVLRCKPENERRLRNRAAQLYGRVVEAVNGVFATSHYV